MTASASDPEAALGPTPGTGASGRPDELYRFRVSRILMVSSLYDYFILEEDGRLGDRLASAGAGAPGITQVAGGENALAALREGGFDLVVTLARLGDMDPFTFGRSARETAPGVPVVLLAHNTPELARLSSAPDRDAVDRIFVWLGDGNLLHGIISLVEDHANAPRDCGAAGVPALLLVEDSVLFYSRYIHGIHSMIGSLMEGILNAGRFSPSRRLARLGARPRILLACDYEEAVGIIRLCGRSLVGLVTDQAFPRNGESRSDAGLDLIREARLALPALPVILQTSEEGSEASARELGVRFLAKSGPSLLRDLGHALTEDFGFGSLGFTDPRSGRTDLVDTVDSLFLALDRVPAAAAADAVETGRLTRWLRVHTELDLARRLDGIARAPGEGDESLRSRVSDAARDWRRDSHRGTVPSYSRSFYEDYAQFSRIGCGSIGGKGRGLAFIDRVLTAGLPPGTFPGVEVGIPRTLVLTTEVFEEFMEQNELLDFAVSGERDLTIIGRFLRADLPPTVLGDLRDFLGEVRTPLAVRSSSLLEDALYQPFAGVYATKMLPNNQPSFDDRFRSFISAVKFVYASTYLRQASAYIRSTCHSPEEEKMALLVQSVVGADHAGAFYPHLSGVGRSWDYYPAGMAKPEDGVVNLALGLGKAIVDGGLSLRFCPRYPKVLPQFGSVRDMLKQSQKRFWAVDMHAGTGAGRDEEEDQFLVELDLERAGRDGVLEWIASTYSPEDDRVYDGVTRDGPRVLDFAHILKNAVLPLPEITSAILEMGRDSMNCPVEIEFACVLGSGRALPATFSLLQIRPMVAGDGFVKVDIGEFPEGSALCRSGRVLGNGTDDGISDILFVRPGIFEASRTRLVAREVDLFNQALSAEGRPYLLVGPGRWGSSDPWLGVPVNWSQISGVRTIVEVSIPGMNVDPSQGSHFFQNMTSLGIGYFTVSHTTRGEMFDWDWLESLPPAGEAAFVRHVRLDEPLRVMIDGRCGCGVILKRRPG